MTPEPEKEPTIESAEDLRKLLDEAGMPDVPVFEVDLPELTPEAMDQMRREAEEILKREEKKK